MNEFIEALNARKGDRTLSEYAEEIGISVSALSRILRGQSGMSSDVLRKIFQAHRDLFPVWLKDCSSTDSVGAAA